MSLTPDVSSDLTLSPPMENLAEQQTTDATSQQNISATPSREAAKPVKVFGFQIGGTVGNKIQALKDWGGRWRRGAIEKTPRVIVNNSSNVIGMMQFVAEAFMFRSSGYNLVNKLDPQKLRNEAIYATWKERPFLNKLAHYIYDPAKNILDGVFLKGGLGTHPLQKDFYEKMPERIAALPGKIAKIPEKLIGLPKKIIEAPGAVANAFTRLNDTKAATLRDRVIVPGTNEYAKMTNKWSARSSFLGLCAMAIAAILPDKKDTPEETEKYVKLSREHPVKYVATRLYQAINPVEWFKHKRQFSGLGMMWAGIFSFISGFRQVAGKDPGKQLYMRNGWQMAGGIITALGGTQLMLAVDNDTGWRNFGLTQLMRLSILPSSILTRYHGIKVTPEQAAIIGVNPNEIKSFQEQGAGHYFAAQGVLQAKNIFASSVGGAEKGPDGSIVDHKAMRDSAKEKVKEEMRVQKARKHKTALVENTASAENDAQTDASQDLQPKTNISKVEKVTHAMPERVEKHAAEAELRAAELPA